MCAFALCAVVALPAPAGAGPTFRAAARCPGADTVTRDARPLMQAIICLHNRERRRHALPALRWNAALTRAARAHGQDMVRRRYFGHRSPQGGNHMDRLARAGYGRGACWSAGENLLLSRAGLTPRQAFDAWMASTGHRRNILMKAWHEFGFGAVMSAPSGAPAGMTLVALFGTRTRGTCA